MSFARACCWIAVLVGLLAAGDAPVATRRIVILGASVSDGFGVRLRTTLPDGRRPTGQVTLADMVAEAARDPGVEVIDLATDLYFLKPETTARRTAAEALEERPTLVLAIDWLFWNAYGVRGLEGKPLHGCDDREALLEAALARLDTLAASGVPMVVGDLPDMRSAVDGGMLVASMVPPEDCLKTLNGRLRTWAGRHPNVAVLALGDLVRCTLTGQPLAACGQEWSDARLGPLMQRDRLHPTLNGTMAVLASALEAADRAAGQPVSSRFDLEPDTLRRKLRDRVARQAGHAARLDPPESGDPAPRTDGNAAGSTGGRGGAATTP